LVLVGHREEFWGLQVGRYPSLNVTDGNDARFAGKAVEPYRQYSVDEVMDILTQGGKTVNPDKIPVCAFGIAPYVCAGFCAGGSLLLLSLYNSYQ
jgi:hypothetical protein